MFKKVELTKNEAVCAGFGRVTISCPEIASAALPGQFVMLKCWKGNDPFLPRPFSINSVDVKEGTLEILYKIIGAGTEILASLLPGAEAEITGPLGNSFPISENAKRIAVIGRGVGAAPMRFLAEYAVKRGIKVRAYISASKDVYLFDKSFYEEAGCPFSSCVNPNEKVTTAFENDLNKMKFDAAYVCGSKRLMRDVSELSDRYHFDGFVSLEARMACGIGACKGCVVEVINQDGEKELARVCKEGPVFPIKALGV